MGQPVEPEQAPKNRFSGLTLRRETGMRERGVRSLRFGNGRSVRKKPRLATCNLTDKWVHQTMKRIAEELGFHRGLPARALCKHEVAAALCRAGILAGLWSVPEFEIRGRDGVRRINLVWARRESLGNAMLWRPVAAFEVEGINVAGDSIRKNADSLTAAAKAGAIVRAMVLFQVGPDGQPWCDMRAEAGFQRAAKRLGQDLINRQDPAHEVVLDEELCHRLASWVQMFTG